MLHRQLELFLSAYERKSFRTAARALGLTQPALTKSIRVLEESLGVVLFDRRASGVIPTPHADSLARYARTMVSAWRLTQAELAAANDGSSGDLRIGAGSIWSLKAVPAAMVSFQKHFPNIRLTLETGVADYLLPKLSDADIDIFVGSAADADDDEIAVLPIVSSPLAAFVRKGHALAKRKKIEPAQLVGQHWMAFANDVKGLDALRAYFSIHGLPAPAVRMKFTALVAMMAAAQMSDDIAYLSANFEPHAEPNGLTRLDLAGSIWSIDSGISYRRSLGVLRHVNVLIQEIKTRMLARG